MSRIFIPVSGRFDQHSDIALADLKAMGASRVFIAIEERFPFEMGERRDRVLSALRDKVKYYTDAGLEAGVWIDTLGYGGEMPSYDVKSAEGYTRIRSIIGNEQDDALCPLDESFSSMMCSLIADIVRVTGTRMLMLDDELCLSVRPGIGCACDRHLAAFSEMLGEKVELSDIPAKVFSGAPSRYRSAWLSLMRKTLTDFCRKIRAAVDEVDKSVRVGFCSGYTSWDLEGADAVEISRILAGDNPPFLRFTGAPYWISSRRFERQSLQSVIECTRMQYELCKNSGIEVFTEADTYPRDRFNTPAALSECFDIVTRSALGMDALKYVYEYSNQPSYERGYVKAYLKNMPVANEISEAFSGKHPVGIRVYETVRKVERAVLPEFCGRFTEADERVIENLIFSPSAAMLTENAIPTTYEGTGACGIVFGESAREIDLSVLSHGIILDAKAAEILSQRGVDTGLRALEYIGGTFIEKHGSGEDILLFNTPKVAKMELSDACEVLSRYFRFELYSDESYPAVYRYENASGEKFLVFGFDAELTPAHSSLIRSYAHARDILDTAENYFGEKIPVICDGHPMLYALAAEDADESAVLYVNIHPDAIDCATVKLAEPAAAVHFIGCEGRLVGDFEIEISHIEPYGFAAFVVSH
ncbi:MAG: hypothetical protein IJW03_01260 [Clostridia bacterium]|nr:hypothetical protein [Clostridia bacterium]